MWPGLWAGASGCELGASRSRFPRHVGTLDHEGTRRSRIDAHSGPAGLAGVLTAAAAAADFRRRDHGDTVLLVRSTENRRSCDHVFHLIEDLHHQPTMQPAV